MTELGYFARLVRRAAGTAPQVRIRRPDTPSAGDWGDVAVSADAVLAATPRADMVADRIPSHERNVRHERAVAATEPPDDAERAGAGRRDGDAVRSTAPVPVRSRRADQAAAPGRTPPRRFAADDRVTQAGVASGNAPSQHATYAHATDVSGLNGHATRAHDTDEHVVPRPAASLGERHQPMAGVAHTAAAIAVTTERASERPSRARDAVEGHRREPRDVEAAWQIRRPPSPVPAAGATPERSAPASVTIGEVRVEIVEPRAALVGAPAPAQTQPAIRGERLPARPPRHAFGLAQL